MPMNGRPVWRDAPHTDGGVNVGCGQVGLPKGLSPRLPG
jgi:hypothetical protein